MMHEVDDEEGRMIARTDKEKAVSVLRAELVRHVLRLPDETRAKLLAFLHLADDLRWVDGDLHVGPDGEVQMTLVSGKNPRAKPRSAAGNGSEPLQ